MDSPDVGMSSHTSHEVIEHRGDSYTGWEETLDVPYLEDLSSHKKFKPSVKIFQLILLLKPLKSHC